MLGHLPLELRSLADLPAVDEPDETGTTFAANALLKARYYAQTLGLPTVAEDSGLEIDALAGRPGVHSARYPGETYPDKFAKLYRELEPHPRPWTARYVCALAFVDKAKGPRHQAQGPGPKAQEELAGRRSKAPEDLTSAIGPGPLAFQCEATVGGEIAAAPLGSNGFGYDPIFFYPPYGLTFGEVDDDRKLAVAHRGRAFREFARFLLSPPGKREQ